jgi:hypothetical protein
LTPCQLLAKGLGLPLYSQIDAHILGFLLEHHLESLKLLLSKLLLGPLSLVQDVIRQCRVELERLEFNLEVETSEWRGGIRGVSICDGLLEIAQTEDAEWT